MLDATGLSTSAAGWIASSNCLGYVAGALSADWLCGSVGCGRRSDVRLLVVSYGITGVGLARRSRPAGRTGAFGGGLLLIRTTQPAPVDARVTA